MNPYVIVVVAVAFVLNGFYWHANGVNAENTRWKAKTFEQLAKDSKAAKDQSVAWQTGVDAVINNLGAKHAATQRHLNIALNGLRDRPDRHLPDDPRANCTSATGAELSRPDGQFLAGEAARADELRDGLEACYAYADTLRQ